MSLSITRMPNGVTVLSECLPAREAVALGIWLDNGSRHQRPEENGLAHLLEHMLFKGTRHHTVAALNAAMEDLGSTINAYTDRELTVFHGTVLGEDLEHAFGLLEEIVLFPSFPVEELRVEKAVVAQETAMAEEDVEDWVQDRLLRRMWGKNPLAWPVLGSSRIIRGASRARLQAYHAQVVRGQGIAIVAAGAVEHGALCRLAERAFAEIPAGAPTPPVLTPVFHPGSATLRRTQATQAHLAWGAPACAAGDPAYYAIAVGNAILGGGAASRLFQELRERRGLAYQAYSHLETCRDVGEWQIYVAAAAEHWRDTVAVTDDVVRRLVEEGPTAEEVERARRGLRVQLLVGLEDSDARMHRLGRQWFYLGRVISPEESLERLAAVRPEEVHAALAERWRQSYRLQCLPPSPDIPPDRPRKGGKVA